MEEKEIWIEVRFEARKGDERWVGHGIGRDANEALATVRIPVDYDLFSAEVTRKNVDPKAFELYKTSDVFKELRDAE